MQDQDRSLTIKEGKENPQTSIMSKADADKYASSKEANYKQKCLEAEMSNMDLRVMKRNSTL